MIDNQNAIQRQYDEIIATNYDRDSRNILASSFQRGIIHLQNTNLFDSKTPFQVLDIGIGTGSFLAQISSLSKGGVKLFGLDVSEKMLDIAHKKNPNLTTVVGSAANTNYQNSLDSSTNY